MVIRVHNPKHAVGKNTGSVGNLVDYLDKENQGVDELEQKQFFNKEGSHFDAETVEKEIDNNRAKLKKTDTKYYMITVNPSQRELEHIGHDEEKFKDYINDLMDKYAENFNRTYSNGEPLTGNDILYFAKIEHERTYKNGERKYQTSINHNKRIEKEIRIEQKQLDNCSADSERKPIESKIKQLENQYIRNSEGTIIKEGALKDGNNLHAHIIISRLDKSQTMQLSPMSNHKQSKNQLNGKEVSIGFNRDNFVASGEKLFDKKFEYNRTHDQSYSYYKETKNIRSVATLLHLSNPKAFAKLAVKRAINEMVQDKTLQKHLGYVMSDPKRIPSKMVHKLETKAIESVVKAMGAGAYTNPVTAGVQVAKQAISIAAKTVSKGMGI